MKLLKIYNLVRDAYDDLERLVEPVVVADIREERSKLKEAMELLEQID